MKIKVIKNGYIFHGNIEYYCLIDEDELKNNFIQPLVIGDIWESTGEESYEGGEIFECIEGKMKGEINDGLWGEYKNNTQYFKII